MYLWNTVGTGEGVGHWLEYDAFGGGCFYEVTWEVDVNFNRTLLSRLSSFIARGLVNPIISTRLKLCLHGTN